MFLDLRPELHTLDKLDRNRSNECPFLAKHYADNGGWTMLCGVRSEEGKGDSINFIIYPRWPTAGGWVSLANRFKQIQVVSIDLFLYLMILLSSGRL